ncbi:MAG: glycosyltransferase [Candidatus Rokuibacteriota bacterium]|nr:MAG: glycosyltransferase [Candidatus Rokubacteria bacterium]
MLGGADISMGHLLARLDPSIEVTVLGVAANIVERVASGRKDAATRIVPRPRSGHDWRSLEAHVSALRQIGPDVVHANLSSPWSCQYCIAGAGLLRRPRVVAVYQLAVPPRSRAQRRAKRLTARAVHRHVGVAERTSREVEALVGLRAGSVLTIHNGVPDELRPGADRPREGLIVGAIGRFERQKGFDLLIRALTEIEDASLVLVGEGSERPILEDLAERFGVADLVLWRGWTDEARSYFAAFDVIAFPSRFEGFPLGVLEALLARSAVVATDVGGVSEIVHDGETGLLVRAEDPTGLAGAIRRLLADADLRHRLGEQGRQRVLQHFTADHMTRGFERLYDELLTGNRL